MSNEMDSMAVSGKGKSLLVVDQLHVVFPGEKTQVPAVKGISFSIETGEILGIVGESGSGKTVSALAVAGLLPPSAQITASVIELNSRTGSSYPLNAGSFAGVRGKEIGFIFQEPGTSLNPVMPCGKQIVEVLSRHLRLSAKASRQKALEWIDRVQIGSPERIFRAFPHELSGGQKQRVMIAMAMCTTPGLLIADEPTTALDTTVQKEILTLIRGLREDFGTVVLFISHDLNVVGEIADRVLVMRRGEIVEQNLVAGIFDHPRHPYTRALLNCRPGWKALPRRLPTLADFESGSRMDTSPAKKNKPADPVKTGETLLTVEHLSTWFPLRGRWVWEPQSWIKAVDEVSFSLDAGETLGVVGESGSGKTTLGRTLLGLIPPHGGKVTYQGEEILNASPENWKNLRRKLQIIFQDPFSSLNPRIPIKEAILEPLRYHRIGSSESERMDWVETVVRKVGLEMDQLNRHPHAFSGGQRQRISIARAIALKPHFLVCDEAVSSLDVSVQAQVLNLLKDLQEELGLTYLFISHDLSVIRFMSDRLVVMKEGRILESGQTENVFSAPVHPYTRQLISAVPGKKPDNNSRNLQPFPF